MQTKKRFLSWLLVLAMIFAMIPSTVMAVDTTKQSKVDGSVSFGGVQTTASFGTLTDDSYHVKSNGSSSYAVTLSVGVDTPSITAAGFVFEPLGDLAQYVRLSKVDGWFNDQWTKTTGPSTTDSGIQLSSGQIAVALNSGSMSTGTADEAALQLTLSLSSALPRGNYTMRLYCVTLSNMLTSTDYVSPITDLSSAPYVDAILVVADADGNTDPLPGEGTTPSPVTFSLSLGTVTGGTATLQTGATADYIETAFNGGDVTDGTWVKVSAVANPGYTTDDMIVRVNGVRVNNPFQVTTNSTVTVELQQVTTYALKTDNPANGSVTFEVNGATVTKAAAGDEVTIVAKAYNGYAVDDEHSNMTVVDANNNPVTVTDNKFTMPASDVTVGGIVFKSESSQPTDFDITLAIKGAGDTDSTASLNGVTSASEGAIVTVYVKPEGDKAIAGVTVRPSGSSNFTAAVAGQVETSGDFAGYTPYTFTMPGAAVDVVVTFCDPFTPPDSGKFKVVGNVVIHDVLNGNAVAAVDMEGIKITLIGNNTVIPVTMNDDGTFVSENAVIGPDYTIQATLALADAPKADGWNFPASVSTSITSIQSNKASIATSKLSSDGAIVDGICLSLILFYDADVNNDPVTERVYAGPDGIFGTTDDVYALKPTGADLSAETNGDVVAGQNVIPVLIPYHAEDNENQKPVWVHVDGKGVAGSPDAYYKWDVLSGVNGGPSESGVKVYVGDDLIAGLGFGASDAAAQDHYMAAELYPAVGGIKVQHAYTSDDVAAGKCEASQVGTWDGTYVYENLSIFVGKDNTPGTADDYYDHDVNLLGNNESEHVTAGADGIIGTCDDVYVIGDKTIYIGEDMVAGSNDDWYAANTDGDDVIDPNVYDHSDTHDKVFIGLDRTPGTADDSYIEDVDNDRLEERVFIGEDGKVGGTDDTYFAHVPANLSGDDEEGKAKAERHETAMDIKYNAATIPDGYVCVTIDPNGEDHFQYVVGDETVTVYVGVDGEAGTADDHFAYDVPTPGINETGTTTVDVNVGPDGIPGTADDTYQLNVDGLDGDETVSVGEYGIPGNGNDNYTKDVNDDGDDETVYAGNDGRFTTEDDYYSDDVSIADAWDKNGEATSTSDENVYVYAGEDGKSGTDDDYYNADVNGDDVDEKVYVGSDKNPGTEDDWYEKDLDGDGKPEKIIAGDDNLFPTDDDHYQAHVPHSSTDPEDEVTVYAGSDHQVGTPDDYYILDDGTVVYIGEDHIAGTQDDFYKSFVGGKEVIVFACEDGYEHNDKASEDGEVREPVGEDGEDTDVYGYDVDHDGTEEEPDNEVVHVGPDGKPGTEDDWYEMDADHDGDDEKIHVGPDGIPGTNDDWYEGDPDGDGVKDTPIYAGNEDDDDQPKGDGIIGTEDDFYYADPDDDDKDEKVYVGDDGKPGYVPELDDDGNPIFDEDIPVMTSDDWFYAEVTFDANGGTVSVNDKSGSTVTILGNKVYITGSVKEILSLTALPTPVRSGSYSFSGWDKTLDQLQAAVEDVTVTASWRYTGYTGGGYTPVPKTYTVMFMADGKVVKAVTVAAGKTVSEIAVPIKQGYTALGWFTNISATNEFDFNTKINSNITLYAGYEKTPVKVSGILTVYPHVAYIAGYGDGTVGPNDYMTRSQAAMVFYRLLNDDARVKYETSVCSFTDVESDAWYTTAIATLANAGILTGYGDGRFGPDDMMTRAEFATICARIGRLSVTGKTSFTDVSKDAWYYTYVQAAADNGWIAGYGDGRFGPDDFITRAQVVTILNRVLNRTPTSIESFAGLEYNNWSDNQNPNAWYYLELIEAGTSHDCTFDENNAETWTGLLK